MIFNIIIPTFNRINVLWRAISSVLEQKWNFDINIYIIDDGSTDNTENFIIENYSISNVKYFYKTNWWVWSARNLWIKKVLSTSYSDNDLILFLDSDDIFLDDAFIKIDKIINKYNEFSFFEFWVIDDLWKKTFDLKNNCEIISYKDNLEEKKANWEFFKVLKLDIFINNEYKFPENMNWWEDILWWNINKKYNLLASDLIVRKYYKDWLWITRDFLDKNKINNFLLVNKKLLNIYWSDLFLYNKRKFWLYNLVYARMLALFWNRIYSFKYWFKWFYYSFDFFRLFLYLISLFPFWLQLNNFLIKIKK